MKNDKLFLFKDRAIGQRDFVRALRDVGIKAGDIIFVHSDIGVFGKLRPHFERDELCRALVHALMASVFPRGTLVMPTFNYDFPKTKEYDPKRAPSQVGTLTEFFRKQKGVSRSMHPVFSVASRGPKTRRLLKTALDGFGEHSFFANLRGEKGKIVFLGAPFQSCTFVHHIEQMKGVPYRFMKKFDGRVRTAHGKKKMEITFHVRPLDGSVITELARFEARLRKKKLLRGVRVGAGEILAISACDIFREGISMLKSDTRAFLAK